VAVAKSMYRVSMVVPTLRIGYLLGSFPAYVRKKVADSMGFDGSDFCWRIKNDLMFGALLSVVPTGSYLDLRRRGFDISAVRYEDLVARPLDMCRVLLEFCRLPQSLAELGDRAFDVDAHRNAPLANSIIGHFREPELTPQAKEKLNEMLTRSRGPRGGKNYFFSYKYYFGDCNFVCTLRSKKL